MGKPSRSKVVKDLKNISLKKLFYLFKKADKERLKKAIASRSTLKVSKELGISEKELKTVLRKKQNLSFKVFDDYLRLVNLIERIQNFRIKHSHHD